MNKTRTSQSMQAMGAIRTSNINYLHYKNVCYSLCGKGKLFYFELFTNLCHKF